MYDLTIMESYSHTALPQTGRCIRLATLLTSNNDAEIAISLQVVDLDKKPKYTAFSYVWGDYADRGSVLIEGKQLGIPANLVQLLRHVQTRLSEKERSYTSRLENPPSDDSPESESRLDSPFVFWADAICICQTDTKEKTLQVPLMRDIFENSQQTLGWLSEATEEDRVAIDLLKELASNPSLRDPQNWIARPDLLSAKNWKALRTFGKKPFWTRVWILQEFMLPRRLFVACGSIELNVDDILIEAILTWIDLQYPIPNVDQNQPDLPWHVKVFPRYVALFLLRRQGFKENGMDKHIDLLFLATTLVSSDPRDKIYGILGVTKHDIVPDYTKSIREVYTEYSKERVRMRQGEYILYYAGSSNLENAKKRYSLPSWVADWTAQEKRGARPIVTVSRLELKLIESFRVDSDSDLLRLKAIRLQRITKTYTFRKTLWEDLEFWHEWGRVRRAAVYPTGVPTLQVLFRTLLLNNDETFVRSLDASAQVFFSRAIGFFALLRKLCSNSLLVEHGGWSADCCKDFERYLQWVRSGSPFENITEVEMQWLKDFFLGPSPDILSEGQGAKLTEQNTDNSLKEFIMKTNTTIRGRTFIWTDGGYYGIGPKQSRVGDELIGVKDSFIRGLVRKSEDYEEYVGSCFVLGLMEDSFSTTDPEGDLSFEELVIA